MLRILASQRKRIFRMLIVATLTMSHISCATLFQLPLLLLQLPFQIISMTLRLVMTLLPYVIKFAPLALMFIDNQHGDVVEYYVSLPGTRHVYPVSSQMTCVVYDLRTSENVEEVVKSVIRCDGKVLFSRERQYDSAEEVDALHAEMERLHTSFAWEKDSLNYVVESQESYV